MDRSLTKRVKPEHLVCGTGWAFLVIIVCGYFAYRTFVDLRTHEYEWNHNWWDVATWTVWAVLGAGLASEVRCWRERLLFAVLFIQFLIGCVFSLWSSARFDLVREARQTSLILWCVAALLGIVASLTRQSSGEARGAGASG